MKNVLRYSVICFEALIVISMAIDVVTSEGIKFVDLLMLILVPFITHWLILFMKRP